MAAAWYPCATKISCAAPSSCRRLATRGSRELAGLACGVAVTRLSDVFRRAAPPMSSPSYDPGGAIRRYGRYPRSIRVVQRDGSAVIVFVEFHRALLFGGVCLVHVERHLGGFVVVEWLLGIVGHALPLLHGIGGRRLHIVLAHPPPLPCISDNSAGSDESASCARSAPAGSAGARCASSRKADSTASP